MCGVLTDYTLSSEWRHMKSQVIQKPGFGGTGHAEAQKAGSLIEAGKGNKKTAHAPLRHYFQKIV